MKELTETKSDDGSGGIDELLAELKNETLPEDSDKPKQKPKDTAGRNYDVTEDSDTEDDIDW